MIKMTFFKSFSQMECSKKGLPGAGEWHVLKDNLPSLKGKDFVDLGCGYGWHCEYAHYEDARSIKGYDLSEKMIDMAQKQYGYPNVEYFVRDIEQLELPEKNVNVVLNSLTFHYINDLGKVFQMIMSALREEGSFIFLIEHPIFAAEGSQYWVKTEDGKIVWPVDTYFKDGERQSEFLGHTITKIHRSLTTLIKLLKEAGFILDYIVNLPLN